MVSMQHCLTFFTSFDDAGKSHAAVRKTRTCTPRIAASKRNLSFPFFCLFFLGLIVVFFIHYQENVTGDIRNHKHSSVYLKLIKFDNAEKKKLQLSLEICG